MKQICTRLLFLSSSVIAFGANAQNEASDSVTRFIVFGHTKSILKKDPNFLESYLDEINDLQADYVFVLGDSGLNKLQNVQQYQDRLDAEVYFAPGNGEVDINGIPLDQQGDNNNTDTYLKNIGYLEKLVIAEHLNFLIINTSDAVSNIARFIEKSLGEITNPNPILIMGHHRIWDDSLINKAPYAHDKSYYFRDIYPLLDGKISYIFAGNSKRQYFNDLNTARSSKRNIHNMYWCDKLGDITCYSVGMGDGYPKAAYLEAVYQNKHLSLVPHYANQAGSEQELLEDSFILPDDSSLVLPEMQRYSSCWWALQMNKVCHALFNKSFVFGFVAASVFGWFFFMRKKA